jgi:hypothetical protein
MSPARNIGKENRQIAASHCTGFGYMPDIVHMGMGVRSMARLGKLASPVSFSEVGRIAAGRPEIFPGRFFQDASCATQMRDRSQAFMVGQVA